MEGFWSKLEDPDFLTYIQSFHVVCLMETFLETFDNAAFLPSHQCFVSPALKISAFGRKSGGVLCFVHDSISDYVQRITVGYDNFVVLKFDRFLFGTAKDIFLLSVYIPPQGSTFYNQRGEKNGITVLDDCISELYRKYGDMNVIICGDLNARTGSFGIENGDDLYDLRCNVIGQNRQSCDCTINEFGYSLLSLCLSRELTMLNGCTVGDLEGKYTNVSAVGCSVVDYFIISEDALPICKEMKVKDNILSSHMPLELELRCSLSTHIGNEDCSSTDIWKIVWNDNYVSVYIQDLSSNLKHLLKHENAKDDEIDIDSFAEDLTQCIVQAADVMVKKIHIGGGKYQQINPWFDKECYLAKKKLRNLLHKYTRSRTDRKKAAYVLFRKAYKTMIKEKKSAHCKRVIELLEKNLSDPKLFWRGIKRYNFKYVFPTISKDEWYNHFVEVFQSVDLENSHMSVQEDTQVQCGDACDFLLDEEISRDEIIKAVGRLKPGKAAGWDRVTGEMIKCALPCILSYLHKLFNSILSKGEYPKLWSKTVIVPIHKKGSISNPDNFRGISLISVLSKVFSSIIDDRLLTWLEDRQIIVEAQAGFRKGYSTLDNMFVLHGIVHKYLSRRRKLYCAFIDFKKAFDTVNREALWKVLARIGIKGRLLKVLQSMYSCVSSCVRCPSGCTEFFDCLRGLKQGCNLSPKIFSILINQLAENVIKHGRHGVQLMPDVTDVFLLLFADDVVLISDSVIGLQNQLNTLYDSAKELGLVVNFDKSKVVVFRGGGFLAEHERWSLGSSRLEVTSEYKYLGLVFTSRLSTSVALRDLTQRGRAGVSRVLKILQKLPYVPYRIFFKVFDAQIVPILLYGAEIWGMSDCSVIESVHKYAMKRFLNVVQSTPNVMLYGELGRYALSINAIIRSVKYWSRLVSMQEDRYPRKVYNMMLTCDKDSWAHRIRDTLCKYGFDDVWRKQSVDDIQKFIRQLKIKMVAEHDDKWKSTLSQSLRYSFYQSFKTSRCTEKYLLVIDRKVLRDITSRFRLGCSELSVHEKRYQVDTHDNDFVCPLCSEDEEDEKHFLLECPALSDLRDRHLRSLCEHNQRLVVNELLSSQKENVIRNVSLYLYRAFLRRREALRA